VTSDNGKPVRKINTIFPNDRLGREAKRAFAAWKATLSRKQMKALYSAPTKSTRKHVRPLG
jgi:hypothetical protein